MDSTVNPRQVAFVRGLRAAQKYGTVTDEAARLITGWAGRLVAATSDTFDLWREETAKKSDLVAVEELRQELEVSAFETQVSVAMVEAVMGKTRHESPAVYHAFAEVLDRWNAMPVMQELYGL